MFVATLVPPQPYLLGADPLIIRAVGEALFGRRKDPSQGGAPARSWTQPTLDPDDVVACGELMQAVRTVAKAKRHELKLSPRGFAIGSCPQQQPCAAQSLLVLGRGDKPVPTGFANWQPMEDIDGSGRKIQ